MKDKPKQKLNKYSVSLVYVNTLNNMLRVIITNNVSEAAALGEALLFFDEETKGFNLSMKVILKIK